MGKSESGKQETLGKKPIKGVLYSLRIWGSGEGGLKLEKWDPVRKVGCEKTG